MTRSAFRRLQRLAAVFILPLLLASPAIASQEQDDGRPSFLFILIDDMGYGDLGSYGHSPTVSPNIDQMADEGLRFTQFYVSSPICSPSRASFVTGQYPQRWGINSYLSDRRDNERRGVAQWLDPAAPSVARLLQDAGYATGHFGKWHLGGGRDVGQAPLITEYGFDESLTQFEGLGDRILPLFDKHDGTEPMRRGLETASAELGRGEITWMDRSIVTQAFADAAGEFIEKSADAGDPFYVQLWLDDVHTPLYPPGEWPEGKRERYLAVVKAMDAQLAGLFEKIRTDERLRENTIVVIASDNGPEPGAGTAGPFRGHKATLWEGGIREPLIIWSPGHLAEGAAGTTNDKTVLHATDWLPSIASLAGVEVPAEVKPDGENYAEALLGKAEPAREKPLFWRRPPDRPGNARNPLPDLAVRDSDWKLLCAYDGSDPLLFNLAKDPGETKNLADEHPDKVARLRDLVLAWNESMPKDEPQSAE